MLGHTQFRDTWYANAPPWFRTGNAERYFYTLELMRDDLCEKAFQAQTIRMPGQGDASQLPYLANDRALIQGPAETNAAFVGRLKSAFAAWKIAGSALSILIQLQAYISNLQPGVASTMPALAIVGGYYPGKTAWWTAQVGGSAPTLQTVTPSNFNWDGQTRPWRSWAIIYLASVPVGLSGTAGTIASVSPGSVLGQNVGGVWVPGTGGTPVNSPWMNLAGLSGLTSAQVGQWIAISNSGHGNNGFFPITSVGSASTCTIANPAGNADAGPLTWSISEYPWTGPGPVWGSPGYVWGQGQQSPPPVDTGSLVGGVWQPTTSSTAYQPSISWGLSVSSLVVATLRLLIGRWKSAGTYFDKIIFAFDGSAGLAGSAYSPLSSPGTGNPDGTFGGVGKLVNGVRVPTRQVSSPFDCYAQGTGTYYNCSTENIT